MFLLEKRAKIVKPEQKMLVHVDRRKFCFAFGEIFMHNPSYAEGIVLCTVNMDVFMFI